MWGYSVIKKKKKLVKCMVCPKMFFRFYKKDDLRQLTWKLRNDFSMIFEQLEFLDFSHQTE